jgi:hypothetical protein
LRISSLTNLKKIVQKTRIINTTSAVTKAKTYH